MKLKKILLGISVLIVTSSLLIGCNSNKSKNKDTTSIKYVEDVGEVSEENPIVIDKKDKSVTILGKVNGKYFTEPTRHFMVFEEGKNGEKAIITGLGNHIQFYEALTKIGAEAGNNMTADNKEKTHVKGDTLKVTISWKNSGKEYDINEVVKDSNNKKIEMKFGGNLKAAEKFDTGCIACLDSCPVGIVSNSVYTYGAVEKRKNVQFYGNKNVLPKDGTLVAVKYKLEAPCCE